jgi:uncharacterized protein YkwD
MTRAVRGLLLGAALIAASCASLAPASSRAGRASAASRPSAEAAAGDPEIRAFVRLVNGRRAARGCGALAWHTGLARVAQRHSEDMARRRFFGHDNPDGADPFDRLREAGIDFTMAAENVAAGHLDARQVFDGWVGSRGHRRNLDACAYTHHGVGRHENRWTHVFARFTPPARPRRR